MKEETKIVIALILCNSSETIERTLGSIMSQSYKNLTCYVIDDKSTDHSVELINEFIEGDDRFVLIQNPTKKYQAGNLEMVCRELPEVNDEDIIVEIAGGDRLANRKVLEKIVNLYSEDDIWIAHGSITEWERQYPVRDLSKLRSGEYPMKNIRTWKAFLWRAMEPSDMKDSDGDWWSMTAQFVYMYDMIEMATLEHYSYIPTETYKANPHDDTDWEQRLPYINMVRQIVKRKKPKLPLVR